MANPWGIVQLKIGNRTEKISASPGIRSFSTSPVEILWIVMWKNNPTHTSGAIVIILHYVCAHDNTFIFI
jgi:hypothetical protein